MLTQNRCSKAEQLMDFKENLTYKIKLAAASLGYQRL